MARKKEALAQAKAIKEAYFAQKVGKLPIYEFNGYMLTIIFAGLDDIDYIKKELAKLGVEIKEEKEQKLIGLVDFINRILSILQRYSERNKLDIGKSFCEKLLKTVLNYNTFVMAYIDFLGKQGFLSNMSFLLGFSGIYSAQRKNLSKHIKEAGIKRRHIIEIGRIIFGDRNKNITKMFSLLEKIHPKPLP